MPPPPSPPTRVPPPETTVEPKPPAPAKAPVAPAPAAPGPASPGALDAGALWESLLSAVGDKPSAMARLESMTIARLDGATAYVRPVSPAHTSRVRSGLSWLEQRLAEVAGRKIRVRIESPEDHEAAPESEAPPVDDRVLRREAQENRTVQAALDLFQAKLIRVEDAPPSSPDPTLPDPTPPGAADDPSVDAPAENPTGDHR